MTVVVPSPDAGLWVEGQKTESFGTTCQFVSPPLDPGTYAYRFRVRWSGNGRATDQAREVRVQPGDQITVGFSTPAS